MLCICGISWSSLDHSLRRCDISCPLLMILSWTSIFLFVFGRHQETMTTTDVTAAQLSSRYAREKLFNELADGCEIVVGVNGRCERDAVRLASRLYSNFRKAMREDFSDDRPAQPFLFVDGTGASLGKGICHAELGSADFDGSCKQSRSTLSPLSLSEGSDHAAPLRDNMPFVAASFNKLVVEKVITRDDGALLPARPGVCADMQAVKALAAQQERSHPPWCTCEAGTNQHRYQLAKPAQTYADVVAFIDEIGCRFRTEEFMCHQSHVPFTVHRGGRFTPFRCESCGYAPSESQWRADKAAFESLTDEEQKERRRVHNDGGRHYCQVLFMTPLLHLDMIRIGADQLHLIYLNFFKHLFRYTIHENLPLSKQNFVREYIRANGFYSYDAASIDEDPVKRWIGREVKRFLAEAQVHLPFLLRIAAAPIDLVPDSVQAFTDDKGVEEMDVDFDEFEPSPEDIQLEEAEEPLMMRHADMWDRFLAFVADIQRDWTSDTDAYREERAVSYFNLSMACSQDLLTLKPTLQSWVPHISCFIVPRQIKLLGDPTKRSADACESYGAVVKHIIKKMTCRRRITGSSSKHQNAEGSTWQQTFKRGFIEQTFRRCCVREALLHGEENETYLQRSDWKLKQKGVKIERKPKKSHACETVRAAIVNEVDQC